MEDIKKIEAVLFAIGDKIEAAEISRLTRLDLNTVNSELAKLKDAYTQNGSTFILLNEGTKWKLTVREDYMPIVQKIVPKTELSRPVLETLAVIAWKSPVLQSDIINIRSSKGYDHIAELEQVGFVTKQRYGRSYMIRLSQQFFEYFDVKGKEQIMEVFKGIKGTEQISGPDKKLQDFGKIEANIPLPIDSVAGENLPAIVAAILTLPAVSESKKANLPMAQPDQIKTLAIGQDTPIPIAPANEVTQSTTPKRDKKPKA